MNATSYEEINEEEASVLANGTGAAVVEFAIQHPSTNIAALKARVIEVGTPEDLMSFAMNVKGLAPAEFFELLDIFRQRSSAVALQSGNEPDHKKSP